MKGFIAWNGAAVVGCGVVLLLHEFYGAGSLVLAFASAALVFAVLMALDRVPEAAERIRQARRIQPKRRNNNVQSIR